MKAFTFLEVVLTIALFSIISLIVFPLSISQSQQSKIDSAVAIFVSSVKSQQQKAYARQSNSSFGIYIYSDKYVAYQGNSLATATDTFTTNLSSEITASAISLSTGGSEINFPAGSFKPSANGTITFTTYGNVFIFSINKEGLVRYYKQ